jgi:hypothetical protein
LAEKDIPKTVIITLFGLFEFLYMHYGLLNVAQSFQRLMDKTFRCFSWVFSYVDDHLIASRNIEEHRHHLGKFFEKLEENRLVINSDKCVFAVQELEFLGHSLSAAGLVPLPRQVEAIKAFARPRDVKQLQCFLGIINFYRRFIPKSGAILKPLTDSLIGSPKSLDWTPAMDSAFSGAKAALVAAVPLVHPNSNAEIFLACDPSATHGAWRPLSFFSRKLSPPEFQVLRACGIPQIIFVFH